MEINHKKLQRTSRIVYFIISVTLCIFLILLSSKIIGDLDETVYEPEYDSFKNATAVSRLENEIDGYRSEINQLESKQATIDRTIATARENYQNEKQSFDNWLQTRKTLGSPSNDKEVLDRTNRLDGYYKVEQDWRSQRQLLTDQIDAITVKVDAVRRELNQHSSEAHDKYSVALSRHELKVFLVRLLFVGPVLALGIFFIIRFRGHKFWPLFFGFSLFSFYAFFFGLLPYLPSYGGYVRYSVGVLLSLGMGYYAIRQIRRFVDQKKAELAVSTQERARKVQTETAEKSLQNHFCPSCGKDFILQKWEFPANVEGSTYKNVTMFCRHCGLELFKKCDVCSNTNFAHVPYCASCGRRISEASTV